MTPDLGTFKLLGEAIALGTLVGAERYRGRKAGEKQFAGIRTFAILCVLGGICGLLESAMLTTVTFGAVAVLIVLGYRRSPAESIGLTTEFAAILVFWVGYLLRDHEAAAISLGIIVTIFLASKRTLHHFVRERISEAEFEATLKFLAVVLVVYPVLPDRQMGPFGFFNPQEIWGWVILVSTMGLGGYVLTRWLGRRRGLVLGSLAGGVVSTTAVTMSLAERARRAPESSRVMAAAALLANSAQGPRLAVLLAFVNRDLAAFLAVPLVSMSFVGLGGAWLLARRAGGSDVKVPLQNPYSLRPALKFGLFFVCILLLVAMGDAWLGERGALIAAAIAGTTSVSAVALSVSKLLNEGSLSPLVAAAAVLLAITTNSITKWVLTLVHGTRPLALWLGVGLLAMLVAAFALLLAWPFGGWPVGTWT